MRYSLCSASSAMSPSVVVTAMLVLLLVGTPQLTLAKRFDCQLFCRTTAFTGMVGGCRCSFTLFTAKRSPRDQHSVPELEASMGDPSVGEGRPAFTLADLVRLAREIRESSASTSGGRAGFNTMATPRNHPASLLTQTNGNSASQDSASSPLKRKEFEQDLDNGDTSDYLRLPY